MEKQSPILLAFERFKPVETESILRDRGAWQRKIILATTSIKSESRSCVHLFCSSKGNACPCDSVFITPDHRFSVILDFRQVRFSVILDIQTHTHTHIHTHTHTHTHRHIHTHSIILTPLYTLPQSPSTSMNWDKVEWSKFSPEEAHRLRHR